VLGGWVLPEDTRASQYFGADQVTRQGDEFEEELPTSHRAPGRARHLDATLMFFIPKRRPSQTAR